MSIFEYEVEVILGPRERERDVTDIKVRRRCSHMPPCHLKVMQKRERESLMSYVSYSQGQVEVRKVDGERVEKS